MSSETDLAAFSHAGVPPATSDPSSASPRSELAPDSEAAVEPRRPGGRDDDGAAAGAAAHPPTAEERRRDARAERAGHVRPPLGPVHAAAGEAAPRPPQRLQVEPEPPEPVTAAAGHGESAVVARQDLALDERVGHGHAELACQVVVTGAGLLQRAERPGLAQA